MTFHEHKINNTGWIWNGDEKRGVERSKTKRECRTFFHLHFLDQKWSKDLEFALAKLRGLCKYLANVQFTQSCLRTPLSNLCTKNKAGKSMQWGESSFKRAQRCLNIKYGEVSLHFEFTTLPPKPQPLYETKWKGKQGKCSQTNST